MQKDCGKNSFKSKGNSILCKHILKKRSAVRQGVILIMIGGKKTNINNKKGILLVITGPSGVGKDTIISKFLKRNSCFKKIITDTSRLPRAGEEDGKDYNFFTCKDFLKRAEKGEYLEYMEVRPKEYKGTSKKAIQNVFSGKNIIWKIDEYSGSHTKEIFRKAMPDLAEEMISRTVTVYISPEEWSQLREQYFAREKEANREWFLIKLKRDKKMRNLYGKKFDKIIINKRKRVNETVIQLEKIVKEKIKENNKKA